MLKRAAHSKLEKLGKTFKSVAVIGPRQSGKTTLVKQVFKGKPYVSLENPDARNYAETDPRGFLKNYPDGAILDEVQRVPELFSYLQEILDDSKKKGLFILTGSNNFILQQNITQSLAGRIAYLQLLPFSVDELRNSRKLPVDDNELILKGFYPPVYDQKIPSVEWSRNYIQTYIEKDVRQIKNITDLHLFERFLHLLAGRCGQELNLDSLAIESNADAKTVKSWIGILVSSFIIHLLPSHHSNFNKTIVKRPKLYFYDTSLVCTLLKIQTKSHLDLHPLRGNIFENMVVSDYIKNRFNSGLPSDVFFWREKNKYEIDLIKDTGKNLLPIEIKSSKTINQNMFKNLDYWMNLSGTKKSYLLYAGSQTEKRSNGMIITNWRNLSEIK